jgi:glycosyltransferase involved in cell wall biosynthesis
MAGGRGHPELTVVIPTRNRSTFISRCVEGALAQADVDLEVIVVDDASSDATPVVLSEYQDERLRVVRLDKRLGVARARNVGSKEARGEWLAFLDDDDLWPPWKLRCQLDVAHASNADFAYGAAVVIDPREGIVRYGRAPAPDRLLEALLARNVIPGGCSNVIARAEVFRQLGGFDEELSQLADRDLWIRLAETGTPAACQHVVVAYLLHEGNMRNNAGTDGVDELEYLLEKHRSARRRYGVRRNRKAGYHYFARAQLRAGNRFGAASIFALLAMRERLPADLVRALASLAFGRSVRDIRFRLKPRPPSLTLTEIEWLRGRSEAETEWLRTLTLQMVESSGRETDVNASVDGNQPPGDSVQAG